MEVSRHTQSATLIRRGENILAITNASSEAGFSPPFSRDSVVTLVTAFRTDGGL
jgi:hypothetical protein